jgi:hypothetical protein
MDTTTLRQRLHSYVDSANQAELLQLLHLMEDADEDTFAFENGRLADTEERVENYRSGSTKPISAEDTKVRLEQIRKQAGNSDR